MSITRHALVDPFQRQIDYLRLSVTDRCNFRCVYCMAEDMRFLPREQVLSLDELARVAERFVALGTRKIRLTGGEPLVRQGIVDLCRRIARLDGLKELCITTNGALLPTLAAPLFDAGVDRINISFDSLNPSLFRAMTRTGDRDQVIAGIDAAKAAGFRHIKLNTVVMRGRNDTEVNELVRFAIERQLDLAFIEEMPLGTISDHQRGDTYCSSDEVRARIAEQFSLMAATDNTAGPARYWRIAEAPEIRIGFISPHSHNFCGSCNRVRVTAEGRLLLCLGNEHSQDLREVLRSAPGDDALLDNAIISTMANKPYRHHFEVNNEVQIVRFMNMTGG